MSNETQIPSNVSKPPKKRFIVMGVVLVAIAVTGFVMWLQGRGWVSTDDAQIQGDLVPISPRVAGYMDKILVDDNQAVRAGQVLAQMDSRDLSARLRKSQADLALQAAQGGAASTQVSLVQKTSTAGEAQATAAESAAQASLAVTRSQLSGAEAQAASARSNAQVAAEAVASARDDIETASAQVEAAQAALSAAYADVQSAEAQAKRAESDATRYQQLYEKGATSAQQLESAHTTATSAQAALKAARDRVSSAAAGLKQAKAHRSSVGSALRQAIARAAAAQDVARQAQAGLQSARKICAQSEAQLAAARAGRAGAMTSPQQIAISEAQKKSAAAKIQQSIADVQNSELQLSYTRITAPVDGIVSQKSVQPGQYVQPGQLLMAIVPLSKTWIIANFKETDVGRMMVGQRAKIMVDMYPRKVFTGKVESIGAATGSKFSVLPSENATGNYVKVVQRIPVKIVFDGRPGNGIVFRPGMNVVVKVQVGE